MNIHCPHCQKELMIPDQYAGKEMQCPLCRGTFMAPSMPASQPSAASPAPAQQPEAFAMQPPAETPPGDPPDLETDAPGGQGGGPAAPPPKPPTPPQPEIPRPTEHTHKFSIWLSPSVIQWIVVGAMVLIFVLTFFPWIGYGFGGVNPASQNAWAAAFGVLSVDEDVMGGPSTPGGDIDDEPGINLILIFYLIIFVIIGLLVVVGVTVLGMLKIPFPAAVQKLLMFRWTLAGGFCLLGFLLISLQLVAGFSFENEFREEVIKEVEKAPDDLYTTDQENFIKGFAFAGLFRGWPLTLTFWLHLIAALGGSYLAWIDMQKSRPIPRIDLCT